MPRPLRCLLAVPMLAFQQTSAQLLADVDVHLYRERGHVLTRGVLNTTAVSNLAVRLRTLFGEHGRTAFSDGGGQKEVRFTFAVHELDATVAAFLGGRDGELWRAAAKLAGTQELCVLMDRGFSKDPGDPETHWHRDDEAIGLPAVHPLLRTVHAWIPMRAMGKEMGTLQYLAGTHRRSYGWLANLLASVWGWEFAWWVTSPLAQDDAMHMGDIAWHDGWVLHAAGTNKAAQVRDGYAVSFAFCASPGACGHGAAPISKQDVTCRVASHLFGAEWRRRHREGENDYAKTILEEPLAVRVTRFVWRSVLGGAAGLAVHYVASAAASLRCCKKKQKDS